MYFETTLRVIFRAQHMSLLDTIVIIAKTKLSNHFFRNINPIYETEQNMFF